MKDPFKTKHRLYEWLVMPLDLSNANSNFMRLMNEVSRPFVGKLTVVYFDDILAYSQDEASHTEHLAQVFQVLRQQVLYAKLKKCELFVRALLNFELLFEIECNASGFGIGAVLTNNRRCYLILNCHAQILTLPTCSSSFSLKSKSAPSPMTTTVE